MYQDVHLTVHLYLCKIAFDNWQKKTPSKQICMRFGGKSAKEQAIWILASDFETLLLLRLCEERTSI